MKEILVVLLVISAIISGCCGPVNQASSGSCPYGTYGSACTDFCDRSGQGGDCFTRCMDLVRSEGMGDATTCCKTSVRSSCETTCKALASSTHGDTSESECMDNCIAQYSSQNIPLDSCELPY